MTANTDQTLKILLIDDDLLVGKVIRMMLPSHWQLTHLTRYQPGINQHFHVAFVDVHLSGDLNKRDGIDAIQGLSKAAVASEILAISGDLNREIMEQCLEAGATRFLAKPIKKEEFLNMLGKIESLVLLQQNQNRFGTEFPAFKGNGANFQSLQRQIASLRGHDASVLIEGETGTGKEVVARLLNAQEDQPRPFIAINMSALPDNLFESELFGHAKGAFTGADQQRVGLIEAAHGGDVFFDEIEAFPLAQQPKLLRFLETGEVRKVGSTESKTVKVRCLFATNQDLNRLVREGKFREDLLWRIKGCTIQLPPLRARPEDIAAIAEHFLQNIRPPVIKTLSEDAIQALKTYRWPGNIRELKRVCEQLALVAPLPIIRRLDIEKLLGFAESTVVESLDLSLGLEESLSRHERRIFEKALRDLREPGEIQTVLKISKSTFYKKVSDLGLGDFLR